MSAQNNAVWDRLENGLRELSINKYHEDLDLVRLVIGIILSGGKDRDTEYFEGDTFLYHCNLAGLKPFYVQLMIDKAWHYIDKGIALAEQEVFLEEEFLY